MKYFFTFFTACCFFIIPNYCNAQLGMELMGSVDFANNQEVSDIWAYADPFGNEYAIVGAEAGTYIIEVTDPTDPEVLHFVPGTSTIWRDVKVWGSYAYIINENENNQNSVGLTIIDMSELPVDIETHTYNGGNGVIWTNAHNIWIDESGFAYIFGANYGEGGAIILDLKEDFIEPPVVGVYDEYYIHDGYVRGDTLWAAEIYEGTLTVIDVEIKEEPTVLSSVETPGNFAHNCWLDDAGEYIYTTDEISNGFVGAFDVRDIYDMKLVDRIQSEPNQGSVPHNVFVLDNWLITAWYRDGVVVHDCTDPSNLVEVGYFDTFPGAGDGFQGAWGAYPYLPSGNILISDIQSGLNVFSPTYQRACYLHGTVTSQQDGLPIAAVSVQIVDHDQVETTDLFGDFKTGIALAGEYAVEVSKPGYYPKTVEGLVLEHGEVLDIDVELEPQPNFELVAKVKDQVYGNNIDEAIVQLVNGDIIRDAETNALGNFELGTFVIGTYDVLVAKWGYRTQLFEDVLLSPEEGPFIFELEPGYYDDFALDFGWQIGGEATAGIWERGIPNGTTFQGINSNANADVSGDIGDYAMVTGNAPGNNAGADDVDDGYTVMNSPTMDLSNYNKPQLSFHRYFFNGGGNGGPPNDDLTVRLYNGQELIVLDIAGPNDPDLGLWTEKTFIIDDDIPLTSSMVLMVAVGDQPEGHLVEGGFDLFQVIDLEPSIPGVGVEEELLDQDICVFPNPANDFFTVSFTDLPRSTSTLTLFDQLGTAVLVKTLNAASTTIDISKLPRGIYHYTISNAEGKLTSGKLVLI